jgi:hypothetical protein
MGPTFIATEAAKRFLSVARGPGPTALFHPHLGLGVNPQPVKGRSRRSSSRAMLRRCTASGPSTMRRTRAQA